MLRENRVLFLDGASFKDFSTALSNIHSETKVFDFASGDRLFIGSDLPFNHRYIDVSVVNSTAATLTVEVWDGTDWIEAVDIIDETSVSGVPLAQSGILSWSIDKDESGWNYDDTDEMSGSGLETAPKIYGLYWARLTYSTTLLNTTALNYIGHRFCKSEDIESEYPEFSLSAAKTSWKTGKTNWNTEALLASEYIVQDLRGQRNLIRNANQILDWNNFEKAAVHKAAEIIFRGFGKDYEEPLVTAHNAYKSSLSVGKFNVDQNRTAMIEDDEKETNVGYMSR